MKKIAVFASGNGSNAQQIVEHFKSSDVGTVNLILCNKAGAGVLDRAEKLGIRSVVFGRDDLCQGGKVERLLDDENIDFIVLAGFLWLLPSFLIDKYPDAIVNIHPALLPNYGGKGMYGMKVHRAVLASGDKKSGISIHYVNDRYDDGQIIFQATVDIEDGDTEDSLAEKIHGLEHLHYPRVVEELLRGKAER